jgi:hypothetical protein
VGPVPLIEGRWGGANAELTASALSVRLQLICGPVEWLSAIEPEPTGAFVLQSLGRSVGNGRPLPPMLLRGRVRGDSMQLELSTLLPDSTRRDGFLLIRNRSPTWRGVCSGLPVP